MLAFDACTREESSVNRSNSNTPLQALVLLNDPIYHEAARAFAELVLREDSDLPETQIARAFARAVSRNPSAAERSILTELYTARLTHFESHPDAAVQFVTVGETALPQDIPQARLAAMTAVARMILSLHETITRN